MRENLEAGIVEPFTFEYVTHCGLEKHFDEDPMKDMATLWDNNVLGLIGELLALEAENIQRTGGPKQLQLPIPLQETLDGLSLVA